ncbi:hypothetical protein TFLX_00382 [Thermoflexales bacterium]|nr:hypothetical protein TFLX_00382 [Thermoflexales bacterium]
MLATKLKGKVTPNRKLIVDIPAEIVPGAVEVILLQDKPAKPVKSSSRKVKHPAFGIWADRDDITDSAEFAAELRAKVEQRRD